MSGLLNLQALIFSLYYIVPGVIATKFHDLVLPSEKRKWSEMLFALVGYSMFNLIVYILLSPIINKVIPIPDLSKIVFNISNSSIDYRSTILISFVIPAIIGLVSGIVPQTKVFQRLFRGAMLHPVPTAWDYIFGQVTESYFILFHFKSGRKIGGLYSTKSFSTAYPLDQDVYVEQVWEVNETGPWKPVERTRGAYIKMKDCSYIEFFAVGPAQRKERWRRIRVLLKFQWVKKALPRFRWTRRNLEQHGNSSLSSSQQEENIMAENEDVVIERIEVQTGEKDIEIPKTVIPASGEVTLPQIDPQIEGRQPIGDPPIIVPPGGLPKIDPQIKGRQPIGDPPIIVPPGGLPTSEPARIVPPGGLPTSEPASTTRKPQEGNLSKDQGGVVNNPGTIIE